MTRDQNYQGRSRKLYRNPDNAKICGVCSGVAEYFGFETWVVRIITVSMVLMGFGPIILVYFVLYFILDPKPGSKDSKGCFEKSKHGNTSASHHHTDKPYRPSVKEVWRAGPATVDQLDSIEGKFSQIERKLQKMESFVTSNRFELEKEFKKMEQ
ncbi:MAG: envelope stress response membrane protein PspC [Kangiellaceae bacterium]|nr:envelope stress response membrane protein PspC [Kangiellaceae bacterium]MCW8998131.1 envelope stress response membrane protein PspC [Kangiellaceae bacterium]